MHGPRMRHPAGPRVLPFALQLVLLLVTLLITACAPLLGKTTATSSPTATPSSPLARLSVYSWVYDNNEGVGSILALAADSGTLRWRYGGTPFWTAPAVGDGVAYAAAAASTAERSAPPDLYALAVRDGSVRWHTPLDGYVFLPPVLAQGIVYVTTVSYTDAQGRRIPANRLLAFDAQTGARLWQVTAPSAPTQPVVERGVVYVNLGEPFLSAFRASDGQLLWRTSRSVGGGSPLTFSVRGDVIYSGSYGDQSDIFALRARDGVVLWQHHADTHGFAAPVEANGLVYVAWPNGALDVLDATTGALRWSVQVSSVTTSQIALAEGLLYVGGEDKQLYALDATTGAVRWRYRATTGVVEERPVYVETPVVAEGVVFFVAIAGGGVHGSTPGAFYALDAHDGSLRWSYNPRASVRSYLSVGS